MTKTNQEADLQRMLHLVESAQRAGRSELEIAEIVKDAVDADAETERAAEPSPAAPGARRTP